MKTRLSIPLLLLAMTIGAHWKTLLTSQYQYFDSPDLAYQVAPWLQVQAAQLHHGKSPLLWDPYLAAGGQSLIGQGQPGVVNPLNWLLFAAPLKRGFIRESAIHWYFALIRFLAALFCYALCRDLGRSRTASVLASAAFAFAGYIGTTGWPQMVDGAIWAPLIFLFSLRAFRGERPLLNSLLSGMFLGFAWLAGHHQIPLFTTLAVSGLWIFHIARRDVKQKRMARAMLFVTLVGAMVCAGAVQLLPAYSYGQDVVRWVGASHEVSWDEAVPYSVHANFRQPPYALLGFFIQGMYLNSNPFVGLTIFVLAIAAVVLAWSEIPVRLLLAVAVGAFLFSLSENTLLHGLIYALVPLAEKARNPAMAIFLSEFAGCILAAYGLDALLAPSAAQSLWLRRIFLGTAGFTLFLWIFVIIAAAAKLPLNAHIDALTLTALAALFLTCLLAAYRANVLTPRRAGVLLVVILMFEIGSLAGDGLKNRDQGWTYWSQLTRDREIADFLKSRPGVFRVDLNGEDVLYNFGDWYGIETYFGYVASAPQAFMHLMGESRTRNLLGVQYLIAKKAAREDQHEVFADPSTGLKVFETPGAMPRAWAVHAAEPVIDPARIPFMLSDPKLDFGRGTFVPETPPTMETCEGDLVRLVTHDISHSRIDVDMNCRGMVILADGYSKDWNATVDGASVPLYAAYTIVRGVLVEKGHHRIDIRYRPVSVYLGAALSLLSILGISLFWLTTRIRSARIARI